ncbi:glycosyltransferase family 2 protein [Polaribacter sp. R77954]|uniref:glycosyltransferase family 2 protein n=1 Tax=Polaribacter sp. R77954 TaxID=3093870 RepID=UPI0037C61F7C
MKIEKKIAVLLACYNRKVKTLNCLKSLYEATLPREFTLDIFLVDDNSTDGTTAAVNQSYPKVNVIEGNGNLFWNRGMFKAWEVASMNYEYDFYLWLNDDVKLFKNSIVLMLEASEKTSFSSLICGPTCSEFEKTITYGGSKIGEKGLVIPNGKIQECRIIHGNFVLVPRIVYDKIGNLDWSFKHAIGDFDYGLRAIKVGFKNYITSDYIGTCESNPTLPKWCLKETHIKNRFQLLYSPLGYAEPIPFFIYEKRHFGLLIAIKHFILINLRALIPQLWK